MYPRNASPATRKQLAASVVSQWNPYSRGPAACGVNQNGATANSR